MKWLFLNAHLAKALTISPRYSSPLRSRGQHRIHSFDSPVALGSQTQLDDGHFCDRCHVMKNRTTIFATLNAALAVFSPIALCVALALPAQAAGSVQSRRLAGGEIRITCTGNPDLCDQRAARLCSIGYEEISRTIDPENPARLTLSIRCD